MTPTTFPALGSLRVSLILICSWSPDQFSATSRGWVLIGRRIGMPLGRMSLCLGGISSFIIMIYAVTKCWCAGVLVLWCSPRLFNGATSPLLGEMGPGEIYHQATGNHATVPPVRPLQPRYTGFFDASRRRYIVSLAREILCRVPDLAESYRTSFPEY